MVGNRVNADVAVIGGSGFYMFIDDPEQIDVETPYGAPSAPISVGTVAGRRVAFLPRHGPHHEYPPHAIPYRANLWALRSLGVRQVLAPCAVGVCGPRSHPATSWCPTSWSTAPTAWIRRTSRPAPSTCRSGIPTATGCPPPSPPSRTR